MRENTVVDNIRKAIQKHYRKKSYVFKTHGSIFQAVGLPDLVGCIHGRFIGIEVKVPGKEDTLTLKQEQVIMKINRAGGIAFMSTNVKHSMEQLGKLL